MRKLLTLLTLFIALTAAHAQQGNTVTISYPGVPSGTCAFIMYGINAATGDLYDCKAGAWNLVGGGGSTGTVTNATNLLACYPTIGTGTVGIQSSKGECYASLEAGATADVQINNASLAAVALGGYDVVVDLQGAQTLAAPPLGSANFTGYMKVLPGAAYSCTYAAGANKACWPVPAKVTVDFVVGASGSTSSGFTGGGSYLLLTAINQIGFCLAATTNSTRCPAAGGTQAQQSLVKNASVHGANLSGVTLYQNYAAEEGGGYVNVVGVAWANHGVCMDVGGGGGAAINSILISINCTNSQGISTVMTADSVGVKLNSGGLSALLPRFISDMSITNSCVTGGSCAGGANVELNDDVQIAGITPYLEAVHCETAARSCINIGNVTVAGSDTAIASDAVEVHNVTSSAAGDTIRITNGAAQSNVSLFNITNEVASGFTINDQANTGVSAVSHQTVAQYVTNDSSAVVIDTSGTNPSKLIPIGGSNTNVQFNNNGVFGGSGNFTFSASSGITLLQGANASDALTIQRQTNTSPTGNFINFLNASSASLFKVDVLGNTTGLSFNTSGSNGGVSGTEGTGAGLTAGAGTDLQYPDSTNHCWHLNTNNVDIGCSVAGGTSAVTSGDLASYNGTTGARIQDASVIAANVLTTTATMTSNVIPKGNGTKTLQLSSITDNGTTIASAEGLVLGTANCTTPGTAGAICMGEGTAITNVASTTALYPDSTAHEIKVATAGSSSFGQLVRAMPGAISLTAQAASVGTATLCAASAGACNVGGVYHVHLAMHQDGTACSANTTAGVSVQLTWTDTDGTAHSAQTVPLETSASLIALTGTMAWPNTGVTAYASGDFNIDTNGTIIQYATTYAACTTGGPAKYALGLTVTRIQ